ncbi:hypothetical protein D3C72_2455770 [compost metagenome]
MLQRIVRWLPLQGVVYTPAKTAVALDIARLPVMLLTQLGWIMLFAMIAALIYRRGVTKLHVNGG